MSAIYGTPFWLVFTFCFATLDGQIIKDNQKYAGKFIGSLPGTTHNVKGSVYAASENSLYITGFSYDGAGPDAFFWAGNSPAPSPNGFIVPDELGRLVKLNSYDNQNILLKLPDGKTLRDIRWFGVWCRLYQVNFGHISIPIGFDYPKEQDLGRIPTLAHRTRADAVIIKNPKTVFIKNLHYDGAAPDAFFLVGKGSVPHEDGIKVPDENGSLRKLRGYRGQDITLRLPDNLTIFDIDWFGLYCITYRENFGHVRIPKNLNVPADLQTLGSEVSSFPNCETIFPDQLQVSWEVRHPDIFIQLEGKVAPDQYISFGLSGNTQRAQMIGSDVTVVFFDSSTGRARVVDYTLTDKAQCAPQANNGACPDEVVGGKQNSEMILWHYYEGVLKVAYKRKLYTRDDVADQEIVVTTPMTIVAAMGPINNRKEAAYHNIRYTRASESPIRILFGKIQNERNCAPLVRLSSSSSSLAHHKVLPWQPEVIHAKNGQVFRVVIGPAGGDRGYTAITGLQSWGIAYWVDDKIIPEIHVRRGENYTFVVEAGDNPARQAKYHPLYITNNKEGGGGQRPQELNTPGHMVYAGVNFAKAVPDPSPGAGRYCELTINSVDKSNESESISEYRKTLNLICEPGNVASFVWSPDENTPDLVYYQCFTHRNIGWKIVVNSSAHLSSSIISLLTFLFLSSLIFVD